ncbi:hypothetical protein [Brevibacillus massiliensis]|jgi:hypothetical protein|uniref:hypothetical protein n=1 Tax=Brevibacillus massiliensis TaxID=1118054 RepID=UPI0003163D9C|nr:hypothetical protein [Brevibacillus massiliensis]
MKIIDAHMHLYRIEEFKRTAEKSLVDYSCRGQEVLYKTALKVFPKIRPLVEQIAMAAKLPHIQIPCHFTFTV